MKRVCGPYKRVEGGAEEKSLFLLWFTLDHDSTKSEQHTAYLLDYSRRKCIIIPWQSYSESIYQAATLKSQRRGRLRGSSKFIELSLSLPQDHDSHESDATKLPTCYSRRKFNRILLICSGICRQSLFKKTQARHFYISFLLGTSVASSFDLSTHLAFFKFQSSFTTVILLFHCAASESEGDRRCYLEYCIWGSTAPIELQVNEGGWVKGCGSIEGSHNS